MLMEFDSFFLENDLAEHSQTKVTKAKDVHVTFHRHNKNALNQMSAESGRIKSVYGDWPLQQA